MTCLPCAARESGATLTTLAFAAAVLLMGMGTMFLASTRDNLRNVHQHRPIQLS